MLDNRKLEIITILSVGLVLSFLPIWFGEYYLYLIRLVGIYTILALGVNIFMGYAGQINLGSSAFYCIGAYATTMLQIKLNWSCFYAFPISIFFTFLVAWGISYPLLRLRGHTMAIGSLGFATAVFLIAERFPTLTGGEDGISVPPIFVLGQEMGKLFYYYLILGFALAAFIFCCFLVNSRIGRALRAMRDEEDAAEAMGVDVYQLKRLTWLISAVFGGIAGALYAPQAGFLSPSTFSLFSNILVVVMLVVGGLGSNLGSVLGAALMTLLPYLIAGIEEYSLLLQGIILFLVLRFLPDGIAGLFSKFRRVFLRVKLRGNLELS